MKDLSMQVDHMRRMGRSMEILKLYTDGVPITAICDEFECSRTTVFRLARAAGLPRRPKGYPLKLREQVIEKLKDGWPLKDIAKEHSVSEGYVSGVAKAEGLSRYKHGVSDEPEAT